jgi:hypothetical protein
MLTRHELRVVGGSNTHRLIGEHASSSHVQAKHSPVERKDIMDALKWVRDHNGPMESRIRQIQSSVNSIGNTPIREFGLGRDRYGMVVPTPNAVVDNISEDGLSPPPAADDNITDTGSSPTPLVKRPRLALLRSSGAFRSWSPHLINASEALSISSTTSTSPPSPQDDRPPEQLHVSEDSSSRRYTAEDDVCLSPNPEASDDDQAVSMARDVEERRTANAALITDINIENDHRNVQTVTVQSVPSGSRRASVKAGNQAQAALGDADYTSYAISRSLLRPGLRELKETKGQQAADKQGTMQKRRRTTSVVLDRVQGGFYQSASQTVVSAKPVKKGGAHISSSPDTLIGRNLRSTLLQHRESMSRGQVAGSEKLDVVVVSSDDEMDSSDEVANNDEVVGNDEEDNDEEDAPHVEHLVILAAGGCDQGTNGSTLRTKHLPKKQRPTRSEERSTKSLGGAETPLNSRCIAERPDHENRHSPEDRDGNDEENSNADASDDSHDSTCVDSEKDNRNGTSHLATAATAAEIQSHSHLGDAARSEAQCDSWVDKNGSKAQSCRRCKPSLQGVTLEDTPENILQMEMDPSSGVNPITSPEDGSPSSTIINRPGTLLHAIQARNAHVIYEISNELKLHQSDEKAEEFRELKTQWLDPQAWASIYTEPESALGLSSTSADEADIWYLNWDCFQSYADRGYVFNRPVVIKQTFQDSGMYSIGEYMHQLWHRFPDRVIDVHNSRTGECSKYSIPDFCSAVSKADLSSTVESAQISNAINLSRLAQADEPLLTRMGRFRLLSILTDRLNSDVGKRQSKEPSDVEGSLGFNLLGFKGAFSRPHLDYLLGTWVRCLVGRKVWLIVPHMDQDDWNGFAQEGCNWSPRGKARIVMLEKNDVLLMPPSVRTVHAVFTPEPSLMEGGMLWDESSIPEILQGLLWVACNQACTNEAIALQLPAIVDTLELWVAQKNARASPEPDNAAYWQDIKAGIAQLRGIGCVCRHDCVRTKSCHCRNGGRRCTAWCQNHPSIHPESSDDSHNRDSTGCDGIGYVSDFRRKSSSSRRTQSHTFKCMMDG